MLPIFDGHNDTLTQVYPPDAAGGRSFLIESEEGHLDLPRARRGGFAGGFFAIFVPPPGPATKRQVIGTPDAWEVPMPTPIEHEYAHQFTVELAASLFRLEAEAVGDIKVVRDAEELRQALDTGVLAVVWHIEGAEAVDEDLNALDAFYQAGLRSLGIVWSRPNVFGHGVPFKFPSSPDTGPGLLPSGRRLVTRCNELGIMIDLAHLNERGFWDVAEISGAPLVSTHTAANALCRTARNLTDEQIDAIGRTGGVLGVNFHVGDLRADGVRDPNTPLSEIARHVDYVVDRIGVDHVAFGSDFDGAIMSAELGDASGLPRLIALLQERGYSDDDLTKRAHGNWVRLLSSTWH
jgi:membrane dipeptidase